MLKPLPSVTALVCALLCSTAAQAALIMNVTEIGGSVIVESSGNANIAGLTPAGFNGSWTTPALDSFFVSSGVGSITVFNGYSGASSFGPGPRILGRTTTTATGPALGVDLSLNRLFLPLGYVSGTEISSTATFANATIAGVGLTPGVYQVSWGSGVNADTLTVNISIADVPEPGSLPLFLGLSAAFLVARRRSAS